MSELFNRYLFVSGREQPIVLQYRSRKNAGVAPQRDEVCLTYLDDFGRTASIRKEALLAEVVEHVESAAEAGIEIAVIQARSQAKAQQKANADPAIKFIAGGMSGRMMG